VQVTALAADANSDSGCSLPYSYVRVVPPEATTSLTRERLDETGENHVDSMYVICGSGLCGLSVTLRGVRFSERTYSSVSSVGVSCGVLRVIKKAGDFPRAGGWEKGR